MIKIELFSSDYLEDIEYAFDALDAYENGYYDTHNLSEIESDLETIKSKIDYFKLVAPCYSELCFEDYYQDAKGRLRVKKDSFVKILGYCNSDIINNYATEDRPLEYLIDKWIKYSNSMGAGYLNQNSDNIKNIL